MPDSAFDAKPSSIDKPASDQPPRYIRVGKIISIAWSLVVLTFVFVGLFAEKRMGLNEWGDYFAGFVGPVALLWLVLGFFQQQKNLAQNSNALDLQRNELALQRKELSLQRIELTRTADEQHRLADYSNRQLELQTLPSLICWIGSDHGGQTQTGGYYKCIVIENVGAPCGYVAMSYENLKCGQNDFNDKAWKEGVRHTAWVTGDGHDVGHVGVFLYDRLGCEVICKVRVKFFENGTPMQAVPVVILRKSQDPIIKITGGQIEE